MPAAVADSSGRRVGEGAGAVADTSAWEAEPQIVRAVPRCPGSAESQQEEGTLRVLGWKSPPGAGERSGGRLCGVWGARPRPQ